jgi:hypothetical protein
VVVAYPDVFPIFLLRGGGAGPSAFGMALVVGIGDCSMHTPALRRYGVFFPSLLRDHRTCGDLRGNSGTVLAESLRLAGGQ